MLAIDIAHTLDSSTRQFRLSVQLVSNARRIALTGPSGSGKSMTLRALAGLFRPAHASIVQDGQIMARPASAATTTFPAQRAIWLPPEQRHIGFLFQQYALFPHLSVAQNIAIGLPPPHRTTWLNPSRQRAITLTQKWLDMFELGPIATQLPHQISGGQMQRTALARALAGEPRLLLLDEPFSALDSTLRQQMRAEMAQHITTLQQHSATRLLLVTHDEADVTALADDVFEIDNGIIVAHRQVRIPR